MKIIHCADLHIDSKIEYLSAEKTKKMREEQILAFEKMIDFALLNGVKAIIIAGDMFDKGNISQKTKERIMADISQHSSIDFLYLSGNHDEDLVFDKIEIPSNLKFFGDNWTAFDYENVTIAGVKLAKSNSSFIYDTLSLDKNRVNIVTLHGQVVGYKSKEDAEIISIPSLKNKNIDYLALGHIHSYSIEDLDLRGKYAYSGCLKGRGFDEIGEKGFVLLTVENNKISQQFVPLSFRNFYEHNFDLGGYENFYNAITDILKELESYYNDSALIKLNLVGEIREDFVVDTYSLGERLNEKFFFVKVKDKTKIKVNVNDYQNEKSLKGEFIRQVLAKNLTEEQKNKIILVGLKALKGEEI